MSIHPRHLVRPCNNRRFMASQSLRRRPRMLPHRNSLSLSLSLLPTISLSSAAAAAAATITAASAAISTSSSTSIATAIPLFPLTSLCRPPPPSPQFGNAAVRARCRASPAASIGHSPDDMLAHRSLAAAPHAPPASLTSLRAFRTARISQVVAGHSRQRHEQHRSRDPQIGLTTPVPDDEPRTKSTSPFYFEAGYAGWAKRPSRPFPPPFFSPPSGSFSDPLSTHNRASDRRPQVNGTLIRGVTNGDDALLVSDHLIGTNDGVGAWAQRDRGHAPLWSRLLMHFWIMAAEAHAYGGGDGGAPDPVKYLDEAYAQTKDALSEPNEWLGTTTACSALLHFVEPPAGDGGTPRPVLYVTQLGDCKCLVIRPADKSVVFATEEQWHYFDCPRQLGTNSPDTPSGNAVMSRVEIQENDMVLAMSDGVTDNLWEEEITDAAVDAMNTWEDMNKSGQNGQDVGEGGSYAEGMRFVAQELVLAARKIAEDPFAGSPFMERAVEEGLAIEGGKLDDISVVAGLCRKRKG